MTSEAGRRPPRAQPASPERPPVRHSSDDRQSSKDGRATSRHAATNGHASTGAWSQNGARPGNRSKTTAQAASGRATSGSARAASGNGKGPASGHGKGPASGSNQRPASGSQRRTRPAQSARPTATPRNATAANPNGSNAPRNAATAPAPEAAPSPDAARALPPSQIEAGATTASLMQSEPLAALVDEAQAAVSEAANALRDVRERYRREYVDHVEHWERLRTQTATRSDSQADGEVAMAGREVNLERSTLNRIDLAVKSLENAWLFLAREDTSLVTDPTGPASAADAQMRIVEAQEAERTRLAREVHDGPAQALSNAIFQVEVVQRLLDRDEQQARAELAQLREVLSRELRGVRAYLSQLRPPLLADLGLSGAIADAAKQVASALGIDVHVEIEDGVDTLPETVEVVTLRIVQEALQNARKHGQPSEIRVRMGRDDAGWVVEVRDDGRGFDADDPPVTGRRSFGLQFMRERAELIGAQFEVRSAPSRGTAVRMTIPPGAMGMPIPGESS